MHLLGCLLILILIPIILVFVFAGTIISLLFGRRPNAQFRWTNNGGTRQQNGTGYSHNNSESASNSSASNSQQKKIFDKSEGEYIDFEEV